MTRKTKVVNVSITIVRLMLLHKLIIIGDIIYIIVRDSWINVESQIKLFMFVLSHLFKNSNDIHTHKY